MVQFVMRPDNPEVPPPYSFPGITIMSFRLPATLAKLQDLCDELLNIGSSQQRGFEYRAVAGFVDMELVTYPKMVFDQSPFNNQGFATQQELYFRFMVWKYVSVSGLQFPGAATPEWTIPFIFVDNSWSLISGRSVIGFPKVMAQFSPTPFLNANPFNISASALVLETHSPTTKLDWRPIVKIDADKGAAPAPVGVWPWIGLGSALVDPLLDEPLQLLLAAAPDAFSTIELKQFRDAMNPTEACYQAVVATRFSPSNMSAPIALPAATVTVNRYASLDIPGSLGFAANTPLQPLLQYAVTMDMRATGARNLFVNS
jgi:hypothetical protein